MSHLILVIDDSSFMRTLFKQVLNSAGYQMVEAINGRHGLRVLKQLVIDEVKPDLILCDLNMPEMDGITFVKYVKRTSCKSVPVLMVTTESKEDTIAEGLAAGALGWLLKPFKNEQLLAIIKNIFESPEKHVSSQEDGWARSD